MQNNKKQKNWYLYLEAFYKYFQNLKYNVKQAYIFH